MLAMLMKPRSKHVQPLAGPEKAFGQAFRRLREKKGISQGKVSDAADCDRTTVSLIERGLVSAKLETIDKMCKAINHYPSEVMRAMEKSPFYK
jgi:transcriptional regulator with XRE-family HTH domain